MTDHTDVVVVGAGPSGAATASWLSRWGHSVVLVDRQPVRTDQGVGAPSLGTIVTPRAVQRLIELGVDPVERGWHRHRGLRLHTGGRSIDVVWAPGQRTQRTSMGVGRGVLSRALMARARDDGVRVLHGYEAVAPCVERGFVRGTELRRMATGEITELRADYVVVADGGRSRFGRTLGTLRLTNWPSLTTIRGQWDAAHHDEEWVETTFGMVEPDGERLAVTTTVTPLGNGQVTVDMHIPSTVRDLASVQASALLEHMADRLSERWGFTADQPRWRAHSERVPLGLSIRPRSGPTFLVVGNAVGAVNPFNGDGLSFGLESARLAAEVLHEALRTGDPTLVSGYSRMLDQQWGGYFTLGRWFLRSIGSPGVAAALGATALRTPRITGRVVRFMTGLDDVQTPSDPAERAALALARSLPDV
jgi:flavin-dependent dehydrogenase